MNFSSDGVSADLKMSIHGLLEISEMREISRDKLAEWPKGSSAFEDENCVVGVFFFDSFPFLWESWMDAQDLLVHLMGRHLSSGDAKSWDGYLLLVTVGFVVTQEQAIQVSRVRSDTRRVRKLVVTGDDIGYVAGSQSEVERLRRCLGPLMSISTNTMGAATDPLASLPSRVFMDEQRQRNMSTIIDAHKGGKALVPALHGSLTRGARQIGKGEVK